jgi:hypothetical protein
MWARACPIYDAAEQGTGGTGRNGAEQDASERHGKGYYRTHKRREQKTVNSMLPGAIYTCSNING